MRLISIAFAYHSAKGDDIANLSFVQESHLLTCFEQGELKPFSSSSEKESVVRSKQEYIFNTYCFCGMPEAYDSNMIMCDDCEKAVSFQVCKYEECPRSMFGFVKCANFNYSQCIKPLVDVSFVLVYSFMYFVVIYIAPQFCCCMTLT